ncbi:hypothetical protein HK096_001227, partial [Nowakowskiella sp. JEL0078]
MTVKLNVKITDYELSNKIPIALDIVKLAHKMGENTLIFTRSLSTLDFLEDALLKMKIPYFRLDGKTSSNSGKKMDVGIEDFQKKKTSVMIISIKAASVALNLTSASRIIILDVSFNPQDDEQAIGRAHRIGQTKPVYVYRIITYDTFESKLFIN